MDEKDFQAFSLTKDDEVKPSPSATLGEDMSMCLVVYAYPTYNYVDKEETPELGVNIETTYMPVDKDFIHRFNIKKTNKNLYHHYNQGV